MRLRILVVIAAAIMVIAATSASSQTSVQGDLGYFPIEDIGIFSPEELEVDVDLQGAMLQVVAGAMKEEGEKIADLVAGLQRVRVLAGSVDNNRTAETIDGFHRAVDRLGSEGWQRIIKVEEDDEQVYIFAKERSSGSIAGLTVLVNDGGDEVVLVNIVGDIDPVVLGQMIGEFDGISDLSQYLPDDD